TTSRSANRFISTSAVDESMKPGSAPEQVEPARRAFVAGAQEVFDDEARFNRREESGARRFAPGDGGLRVALFQRRDVVRDFDHAGVVSQPRREVLKARLAS